MGARDKEMNRRDFLKIVGISAAATTAAWAGCSPENNPVSGGRAARTAIPTDRMTYRTNDKKGDRCSATGVCAGRLSLRPTAGGT